MEPWEKNRKKSKTRRKKINLESEPKKSFWEHPFFLWYLERWKKIRESKKNPFGSIRFFDLVCIKMDVGLSQLYL